MNTFPDRNRAGADTEFVASADLGSNSFHLVIGRLDFGRLVIVDQIREFVRLGGGLDAEQNLTTEVQTRALDCLDRFGQRIHNIPAQNVRAVGTNALRKARNARTFLQQADEVLGHPIEVITGHEEARLIYQSICYGQPENSKKQMVIDIGGGSTEIVAGRGHLPILIESLYIGCVSMSMKHFLDGGITKERLDKAVLDAEVEIENVSHNFEQFDSKKVFGCSGTIRALSAILTKQGRNNVPITRDRLQKLRKKILKCGHVEKLVQLGFEPERCEVLPGGFAILLALFELLKIEEMVVSDQALREGVLYDLLGRMRNEDIRQQTVNSLIANWSIDSRHGFRVQATALTIYDQVSDCWSINLPEAPTLLAWAAMLHEIGLSMSHAQYHKHGAYILENSDLDGFSRPEQTELAHLVRGHRRKFPAKILRNSDIFPQGVTMRLCVILRLAVLFHRSRVENLMWDATCAVRGNNLHLEFPPNWLDEHPLTKESLTHEREYLASVDIDLQFISRSQ